MATEVVNTGGTGTGSSSRGGITVKTSGSRTDNSQKLAQGIEEDYLIAKFDLKYTDTAEPIDGADLADRLDDPRYYQGDAIT